MAGVRVIGSKSSNSTLTLDTSVRGQKQTE